MVRGNLIICKPVHSRYQRRKFLLWRPYSRMCQGKKSRQKPALLSAAYFALRIPLLDTPFIPDEFFFSSDFFSGGNRHSLRRRQLAIHPPFLSLFHALWISTFGDSLAAIRMPPLLCGLAGILLCRSLADRLPGEKWGFWCALMLSACGAHVHYSVTAAYATFELTSFIGALLALVIFAGYRNHSRLLYFTVLCGVLVSYHFIIFLALSSAFFLMYRRRIPPPRACIGLCALFSILIAANAYDSWRKGIFHAFHHRMISVSTLVDWIKKLPDQVLRYGLMLSEQAGNILSIIALAGAASVVVQFIRRRTPEAALRCFPLLICLSAIAGYLAVSLPRSSLSNSRTTSFYSSIITPGSTRRERP